MDAALVMVDRFFRLLISVPEWAVTYLPGPLGRLSRHYFWKMRMKHVGRGVTFGVGIQVGGAGFVSIGENTWIDDQVIILAGPPCGQRDNVLRIENPDFPGLEGELIIGSNCHIAQQVTLQAHGGLYIGDNSGVASGSRIYSLSHHYRGHCGNKDSNIVFKFTPRARPEEQSLISSPSVMEENTALGLNSVMLPGATIKRGSWVGVLSVVIGTIPPDSVASGIPAAVSKKIR